jgi:hypothetical protein
MTASIQLTVIVHLLLRSLLIATLVSAASPHLRAQESTQMRQVSASEEFVLRHLPDWRFTTKAYRDEALQMLLKEANDVAKTLNLSEQLPITTTNLIGVFIGPPALVALGSIATSNYVYCASIGRTFSGFDQKNRAETFDRAKTEYNWPIDRMNTNRAFQIATQIMGTAGIDVASLNRDCSLEITVSRPERAQGTHFVPNYWVTWRKPGKVAANMEFIEPTRTIRQLHVWDNKYILRQPLSFTNLASLLDQTNAPPMTNEPLRKK